MRLTVNFKDQLKEKLLPPSQKWTRRDVVILTAASVATFGLGCLGYGWAVRENVEVSRVIVKIANLPDEFNGMTIAHLSDIHHGKFTGLDYINRCVEIVNGLNPDIIALTGDYTYSGRRYIEPCAEVLKGLKACVGVYAVLGNHDYYAGVGNVARALRNAGCKMLVDEKDCIQYHGAKLWLFGVDDLYYGNTNPVRLMRDVPREDSRIVLAHNPDFIEEFAIKSAHVDFMLSGHTHGGQIRLPLIGAPHISSYHGQRYAMGMHRKGSMQIYTTRGIGTILLPSRFDCPPEIVFYTLKSA